MRNLFTFLFAFLVIGQLHSQSNTFPSSGNAGIGITPNSWGSGFLALQLGATGNIHQSGSDNGMRIGNNMYWDGTSWKYNVASVAGTVLTLSNSGYNFLTAPGGTAGGSASLTSVLSISTDGFLGIGTTANTWGGGFKAMQIGATGNIHQSGSDNGMRIGNNLYYDGSSWKYNVSSVAGTLLTMSNTGYDFFSAPAGTAGGSASLTSLLSINSAGYMGIGTTPSSTEKLSVAGNISANGNITAKKLTVTQTGWSDYVFNDDYKLRSLSSLETYLKKNKHLPEIPSTKEVEEKGISVGDNQALLLKKIEELTLYVIDLKKENEIQQKQINQLLRRKK